MSLSPVTTSLQFSSIFISIELTDVLLLLTTNAFLYSLGKEKERMKARKFILALYEQGPDYKDQMVPIEMEMYSFTSSLPVLRHIVRESGAVVYVTFYGFAQVHSIG